MKLPTLSDLAKVSKSLKMGAGTEFGERRDGLKGLAAVYGIEFGEYHSFVDVSVRYQALSQKEIDVANGFATDWQRWRDGPPSLLSRAWTARERINGPRNEGRKQRFDIARQFGECAQGRPGRRSGLVRSHNRGVFHRCLARS